MFVFGNPPYLGTRNQEEQHKEDMDIVFGNIQHGMLDYIACWFYKAAIFVRKYSNSSFAFVSTNSIVQGIQVPVLWEPIFSMNLEIVFAYKSFVWTNNAKNKAAVICVIIGVANSEIRRKKILFEEKANEVDYIGPTLSSSHICIVDKQRRSISGLRSMLKGSLPADDNNLTLYPEEMDKLLTKYPNIKCLVKKFVGSSELIKRESRFCLWITDEQKDFACSIPELEARFDKVRDMRLGSSKAATRMLAKIPHKFAENRYDGREALVIPVVSSARRKYIPMDFVEEGTVVYYSSFAIYGANALDFGVISNSMHMLWVNAVGGRLKSDYRYSAQLCYNTFPFPSISSSKKSEIEEAATEVLLARENYPEKTLADLYDPDKMPADLREAHENLDRIVESCYPGAPFANDEARLECLFKLYEKMTVNKK